MTEEESLSMAASMAASFKDGMDAKPVPCAPGPAFSINNRIIVEAYVSDRALKTKEVNGFASIVQKISLKGMKVLVEARVNDGKQLCSVIRKGDLVYIREELLHTCEWAKKNYESDAIEGKFMIVDLAHVEYVVPQ
jgi:hypothetical protein